MNNINNITAITLGLLLPFIGTTFGAAMVFFIKNKINDKLHKALLGFASGVMIAASVWSLIIPGLEMAEEQNKISWIPVSIGFLLGIAFLLLLDSFIPHLHANSDEPEGPKTALKNSTMLLLAVTLHNIPEGMAVGVVLSGLLTNNPLISVTGALALSIGIAIQNFPEGAIISMPLRAHNVSKIRAFSYGMLSGIVEPIFGLITVLIANLITPLLPGFLAFAAGAMIYVVIEELIPESQTGKHSNIGTIGAALGFTLMMILDVALG